MEKTKEAARQWIEEGKPCIYRHGWAWKGAYAHEITKEEALKLLPTYNFGISFDMLSFKKWNGMDVLEFNQLGENDLL